MPNAPRRAFLKNPGASELFADPAIDRHLAIAAEEDGRRHDSSRQGIRVAALARQEAVAEMDREDGHRHDDDGADGGPRGTAIWLNECDLNATLERCQCRQ